MFGLLPTKSLELTPLARIHPLPYCSVFSRMAAVPRVSAWL